MARSIESFDMFSARAAIMAARSRGFIAGSGRPILAATVISRASLLNSLDFTASCRPLRCMMFLNCECPAIASFLMFVRAVRGVVIRAGRNPQPSVKSRSRPGFARYKPPQCRFQTVAPVMADVVPQVRAVELKPVSGTVRKRHEHDWDNSGNLPLSSERPFGRAANRDDANAR